MNSIQTLNLKMFSCRYKYLDMPKKCLLKIVWIEEMLLLCTSGEDKASGQKTMQPVGIIYTIKPSSGD